MALDIIDNKSLRFHFHELVVHIYGVQMRYNICKSSGISECHFQTFLVFDPLFHREFIETS